MIDIEERIIPQIEMPLAKPSDICRSQPREKWCQGAYGDGEGRYCRIGWLMLHAGIPFDIPAHEIVFALNRNYGISVSMGNRVVAYNDNCCGDGYQDSIRVLIDAGF